jgi:hypothetical protein
MIDPTDFLDGIGDLLDPDTFSEHLADLCDALQDCSFTDLNADVLHAADALHPDMVDADSLSDAHSHLAAFLDPDTAIEVLHAGGFDALEALQDVGDHTEHLGLDSLVPQNWADHLAAGHFDATPVETVAAAIRDVVDKFPRELLENSELSVTYQFDSVPGELGKYFPATEDIVLFDHADQLHATLAHEIGHHITFHTPGLREALAKAWIQDRDVHFGLSQELQQQLSLYPQSEHTHEMAADLFNYHANKPELMKEQMPNAFAIIEKLFKPGGTTRV